MTRLSNDTSLLTDALSGGAERVEADLEKLLKDQALEGEILRPQQLMQAMRHGALGGGKRLRPVLLLETARLFGRSDNGVLRAASALECIHCYSLIHDDLPAMDDDDLRRGRPTVHKAYNEASAILAGDALLTLAFDAVTANDVHEDPAIRLSVTRELARAAGAGGMAGGQMLDLQSEHHQRGEQEIRTLQAMKTGALIRFACRAGAILANASEADVTRLTRFGEVIGLGFQLADDLLDHEGDTQTLGKAAGKDAAAGKATLVALNGADWTRQELKTLTQEADQLLASYGARADRLVAIAHFISTRSA